MTVFTNLKKKYALRPVKYRGPSLRRKPLTALNTEKLINFWNHAQKFAWPNQSWYIGTGLHYNPVLDIQPIQRQVCGNHYNNPAYQDTLSFDTAVDDNLLCDVGYTYVRCKITELSIANKNVNLANEDWHRDESPFEALRVIVPLISDYNYMIQLDNEMPVHLECGYAYAFDQSQYHRVLTTGQSSIRRLHLICSIVTWFDKKDKWLPNSNFNTHHPLDIFESLAI